MAWASGACCGLGHDALHHGAMTCARPELSDFEADEQTEVRSLILAGLREHWGRIDETLNPELSDIAMSYRDGRTIVARLPGSAGIVATGTIVPRSETTAEIVRMSVAAASQRMGLGRVIVEELMGTAARWSMSAVVLETSAHWDDVVAFYRSCGFAMTHQESGPFGQDTWFQRACDVEPRSP